ncbi:GntR family transcriptional regulator [Falsigemmobacter intermedius]|uniref:GntR family transcriptional regulator n=1 Tax=Falsigemmobacter intermedius TaxID=1553448 RepID=A0A451GHI1_9RHOB|nr:GntR family transcriptional regulator [Falsigemmobacter intermedius]RWY38411.1 GntR family transcriptional regulator [Falsigemmobacter intermedius]
MRPAEQIRDALIERIITGAIKDGERLDEQRLAEQFGVSRTPLREALQMLSGSGLVRHELRRGTFVHFPSLDEVLEMFQVMAEVEAICGRYAARRISAPALDDLARALDLCREAAARSDKAAYYAANHQFHDLIYEASGNGFLAAEAARLHSRLQPFRLRQLEVRHRLSQSLAEHEAIWEALARGDSELAGRCLFDHVAIQGERFNDLVANYRRIAGR